MKPNMMLTYRGIYTHRPISQNGGEIRILELLPGARSDPIRVTLKHVPFRVDQEKRSANDWYDDQVSGPASKEPDSDGIHDAGAGGDVFESYEAISYAWGSTLDKTAVAVVDRLHYWSLGVTWNCAEALRSLRYENVSRILWMDAICIDQGTSLKALAERGRQVKLMANIFKRAKRVVAWLGSSLPGDEIVADWIDEVATNVKLNENWDTFPVTKEGPWNDVNNANINLQQSVALNAFTLRAWFSRLWIWQEILVGSESSILAAGKLEIFFSNFRLAATYLCKKIVPSTGEISFFEHMNRLIRICKGSIRYGCQVLEDLRFCDCTDPRDRIYVAQNLATHSVASIDPDYTRSWQMCYTDWAWQYVRDFGTLDFLIHLEEKRASSGSLPSWVPDWSQPRQPTQLAAYANGGLGISWSCTADGSLRVQGVVVAKVTDVHFDEALTEYSPREDHLLSLYRLVVFALAEGNAATCESFSRAILKDHMAHNMFPAGPKYMSLSECVDFLTRLRSTGLMATANEEAFELARQMLVYYYGRAMLRISGSRLGLGPRTSSKGDLIVVLLGCKIPLVLRKLPRGRFKVIGKATCSGCMAGEAILGDLPEGVDFVWYSWSGISRPAFRDCDSGEIFFDDPRVRSGVPRRRSRGSDSKYPWQLPGRSGGKVVIFEDGQCDFDQLKDRGVKLQSFVLV